MCCARSRVSIGVVFRTSCRDLSATCAATMSWQRRWRQATPTSAPPCSTSGPCEHTTPFPQSVSRALLPASWTECLHPAAGGTECLATSRWPGARLRLRRTHRRQRRMLAKDLLHECCHPLPPPVAPSPQRPPIVPTWPLLLLLLQPWQPFWLHWV
jgi:hypothetical protein